MNIVQTNAGALQILLDALGSSPTMMVRLFSNNHTFGAATVLGDLTECTFTGYAAAAPTWTTPALSGSTAQTLPSPAGVPFTYSGGSTTTVYGFYLTDSGGTVLYGGTTFSSPVTLSTIITSLTVYPTYTQKAEFSAS